MDDGCWLSLLATIDIEGTVLLNRPFHAFNHLNFSFTYHNKAQVSDKYIERISSIELWELPAHALTIRAS